MVDFHTYCLAFSSASRTVHFCTKIISFNFQDMLKEYECQPDEDDEEDSAALDFEIVDVDEGASMSSDQDELDV